LIEDYNEKLNEIINPDTRRFGVVSLFQDRDDKARRHRSVPELLASAKHRITCFGLTNHSILADRELLLRKIQDGCSFQLLIFNSDDGDVVTRAALETLDKSLGNYSDILKNVIRARRGECRDVMKYLRNNGVSQDKFEVRTFQIVPTFGAIRIDDARLIVEFFGHRKDGSACPGMELVRRGILWTGKELEESESHWYKFYDQQITELWEGGRRLKLAG
jgi:hypothetical protein